MSPRVWAGLLVFVCAALVRLPYYDVSWFGLDQIYFMAEARRVLAGHFDVVGPLASGLNIVGPLYSYLLAALLWIREDPTFLVLFALVCEVVAACLVYDLAQRLFGTWAGIVAGIGYVTAPVLVISTRLIWNPSLLPVAVVLGWWFVVRYAQRPSTARLAAVALTAGFALTLHATGVFQAVGFVLAAMLAKRPSLRQLAVAICVGAIPLVPIIARLSAGTGDVGSLSTRISTPAEPLAIAQGIAQIVLALPQAFGSHWTTHFSTAVLHLQAVVATYGLLRGVLRASTFRPIWIGMAVSVVLNVASAFFYTGAIHWHYFIALVPIACVSVAQALPSAPPWRVAVAVIAVAAATSHLFFVGHFDRRAIASGLIQVDAGRVGLRTPSVIGYAPTLRDLRSIGNALLGIVPDGATAMLVAHGAHGELFRETGAEFMPRSEGPRQDWPTEFLLVGPGATPLTPNARVLGGRVCAFERSADIAWKGTHAAPFTGWDTSELDDARWVSLSLPGRVARPSLAGPFPPLLTWRAPQALLRGRFRSEAVQHRRMLSVVIHGLQSSQHWVARVSFNGREIPVSKERLMISSMSRNQEWLIDLTGQVHEGENLVALAIDGQELLFDLDIFEVPCLDSEWYN